LNSSSSPDSIDDDAEEDDDDSFLGEDLEEDEDEEEEKPMTVGQFYPYGPSDDSDDDGGWCKDKWSDEKCGKARKRGMCKGHSHKVKKTQKHCPKTCGKCGF